SSTVRADDRPGDLLRLAPEQLLHLPPLQTVLRGGKRAGTKRVPVTLAARSTSIGTLELFCVAKEGGNRWKLEFNIRGLVKEPPPRVAGEDEEEAGAGGPTEVWLETQVEAAAKAIRTCYRGPQAGEAPITPQELPRVLETVLEARRGEW